MAAEELAHRGRRNLKCTGQSREASDACCHKSCKSVFMKALHLEAHSLGTPRSLMRASSLRSLALSRGRVMAGSMDARARQMLTSGMRSSCSPVLAGVAISTHVSPHGAAYYHEGPHLSLQACLGFGEVQEVQPTTLGSLQEGVAGVLDPVLASRTRSVAA